MESPERITKLETQMDALKEDVREVKDDIKELHSRITTTTREITDHIDNKIDALAKSDELQHETMTNKIDQINKRVDILERWKWMIVGAAIVIGYLVGHIEILSRLVK
jgi:predicted RNase H-like nuclease (RuvC/YqgF family)